MARSNYERDKETFPHDAYTVNGKNNKGIAFYVLGWETEPTEDTHWTGEEERTGKVLAVMVGDDYRHRVDPDDLEPLKREDYCGVCGQIGCAHDGLDRDE